MRDTDVPVKTAAGQQEIGLKQRKLQPRARSLLIMVHGAETVAQLAKACIRSATCAPSSMS